MEKQEEKFPQERRRAPRISGALVEYTFEDKDAPKKKAFIKDICIYGICIFISEAVKSDAIMFLDIFMFGDDTPIKTKGKVIWQKQGEYLGFFNIGIEFTEMSVEHQTTLSGHITANYRGDDKV